MPGQLITLRNALQVAIDVARPGYEYTDFTVKTTWLPFNLLTAPQTKKGLCWILGSALGDEERSSRDGVPNANAPFVSRELMVQVAFQRSDVLASDDATLDTLHDVQEQLRKTVKDTIVPGLTWIRNIGMKDEDGLPFSYFAIREANLFEAYFATYFKVLYT